MSKLVALFIIAPLLVFGEAPDTAPPNLTYPAILQPLQRTAIGTELTARVIAVYKRMGESFKKGDVLVQLDDESLRALVMKADANVDRARVNFNSKTALYADDIASYNEFSEAKAALGAAEADLILARINLDNATIVAPYDGRVLRINVEEGEYANRVLRLDEKPLLDIANDRVLLAQILVPARFFNQVKIGNPLLMRVQETGEEIRGTISRVGAEIDPISSTFIVEATIDNSDGRLLGGMTGMVQLPNVEAVSP